MISAYYRKTLLAVLIILVALVFPANARATSGSGAICFTGSICVVGEFLYNDSYVAILDATCVITVTKPDGSNLLSSVAMTGGGTTGWYYYNVPAQTVTGTYPTEVRCTTGGQTMAIDKSFQYSEPSNLTATDVENAVWNSERSSHTTTGSFGEALQNIVPTTAAFATSVIDGISIPTTAQIATAVNATFPSSSSVASAVWGYSDRTLTGFGSIITDMTRVTNEGHKNNNPTLSNDIIGKVRGLLANFKPVTTVTNITNSSSTSTTNSSSNSNQPVIKEQNQQNNTDPTKPQIKNFIEEIKPQTRSKISDATKIAQGMVDDITKIKLESSELKSATKDSNINYLEITKLISQIVGDENNSDSLFSKVNALTVSWNFQDISKLDKGVKDIKATTLVMQKEAGLGRVSTASTAKVNTQVAKLSSIIGTQKDTEKQKTLFGQINNISQLTAKLDAKSKELDAVLNSLSQSNVEEKRKEASLILKDKNLALVNNFTKVLGAKTEVGGVDSESVDPQKILTNQLFNLQAKIDSEKLKLVSDKKSIRTTYWFELGSIVFKSQITNPSSEISQTYTMQYYLPEEIKEENVIKMDDGLTLVFDQEKNAYYVTADIILAPSEEKIVSIEVEDVFQYSNAVLDGMRKQAQTLAATLKNTQYYGQGVTIQTDIEVELYKIIAEQENAITPENKIKTYRELKIQYQGVESEIDKLKDLASEASSANSLVGFVGGSQALAVWGLIVIIAGGFIFLAIYMKVLRKQDVGGTSASVEEVVTGHNNANKPVIRKKMTYRKFLTLVLIVAGTSALISGGIVYFMFKNKEVQPQALEIKSENLAVKGKDDDVLGVSTSSALISTDDELMKLISQTPEKGHTVMIVANENLTASIKKLPKKNSEVLLSVNSLDSVEKLAQIGEWALVRLPKTEKNEVVVGWIEDAMLIDTTVEKKKTGQGEVNPSSVYVQVTETPVGYLKVRLEPDGKEISKVNVGDRLEVITDEGNWWEVKLEDGTIGWISKTYTKVVISPLPGE